MLFCLLYSIANWRRSSIDSACCTIGSRRQINKTNLYACNDCLLAHLYDISFSKTDLPTPGGPSIKINREGYSFSNGAKSLLLLWLLCHCHMLDLVIHGCYLACSSV